MKTSLIIAGDASGGIKAAQDFDNALQGAEAEAARLSKAYAAADGAIGALASAQARANTEISEAKAAYTAGSTSLEQYNRQVLETKGALSLLEAEHRSSLAELRKANSAYDAAVAGGEKVTAMAGGQRAGFQQLSMQLGDMSTMYALGAKPQQIFASQMGQVIQSVQLLSGGTSKFAAFLAGGWGLAITGAAMVLVPLIGKLFDTKDALDEVGKAAEDAMAKLQASLNQASAVSDAATDAMKRMVTAQAAVAQANEKLASMTADANALRRSFGGGEAAAALDQEIGRVERRREAAQKNLTAAQGDLDRIRMTASVVIPMQRANQERLNKTNDEGTKSRTRQTAAERAHAQAIKATQREYNQSIETAQDYAASLDEQAAKFGKTAIEIQRMEVAAKAAAAPTAELAQRIREAGSAWEAAQTGEMLRQQQARTSDIRAEIALTSELGERRIAALRGLNGEALENELAAINAEHAKAQITLRAQAEETEYLRLAIKAQGEAEHKRLLDLAAGARAAGDAEKELVDLQEKFDREARSAEILADRVQALAGALGSIKGMGPLGDIFGVLTSRDPTAALLGMGGVGSLLGMLTPGGREASLKIEDDMTRALESVFGPKAENLAETMASLLQGAGIGATVGGIIGGSGTAQIGGMVGGAIGSALGDNLGKAIGGALGESIGEVAGPIVGSIIGSVVGDALAGTKKGRVDLGAGGITNTYGNSDQRIASATALGGSLYGTLDRIAEAFGATATGSFSGAIGIRKNTIRYNPTSGSLRTGKGATIYATEAEAIKAALQDAISDGVFEGLGDGVERLLKGDGDIEAQLQKALSFQGVFDDLKRAKDPQGAAMDDLGKWHDDMAKIFAEAGATSGQLAQLEELTGIKRADIVKKYADTMTAAEQEAAENRKLEIQIMQLEGRTREAELAARELEMAKLDDTKKALYTRIYALQDEASAAQAAAAASVRLSSLQQRLYEAQGNTGAAEALRLQGELTDAQSDAERQLIKQIYAAEAASRRATAAEQRRQEAAQAAEQAERARAGIQIDMLRAVGLEAQATQLQRTQDLKGVDAAVRPLQQFAWGIEDSVAGLDDAIAKFRDFGASLREFRDGLVAGEAGTAEAYRAAQVKFMMTSALAAAGDEKGLSGLQSASTAFLDASRASSSYLQYQRDRAAVLRGLGGGIDASDQMASDAEQRLQAARDAVSQLVDLNQTATGIETALVNLGGGTASAANSSLDKYVQSLERDRAQEKARADRLEAKLDRLIKASEKTAKESEATNQTYLARVVENDALRVREQA